MAEYIFTSGDKYIGMDDASGGYPYETDHFTQLKVWTKIGQAIEYKGHFPEKDWQLREVTGLVMSAAIDYE